MDDISKGKLYLGADLDGYDMKEYLREKLDGYGYLVIDLGVFKIEEKAEHSDIAREVAEKVVENERVKDNHDHGDVVLGILISGEAGKLINAANQLDGARAYTADSVEQAGQVRKEFDANILCIGSHQTEIKDVCDLVGAFLA